MSGLKINFKKSEVLIIGGDNTTAVAYADIFTCQISMFPLKYLGVPISARRKNLRKSWMCGRGIACHMEGGLY
jgi:hypothetical protein